MRYQIHNSGHKLTGERTQGILQILEIAGTVRKMVNGYSLMMIHHESQNDSVKLTIDF